MRLRIFLFLVIGFFGMLAHATDQKKIKSTCDHGLECEISFDPSKISPAAVEALFKLNMLGQQDLPVCSGYFPSAVPDAESCTQELKSIHEIESLLAKLPKETSLTDIQRYFSTLVPAFLEISLVQDSINKGAAKKEQISRIEELYKKYSSNGACLSAKKKLLDSKYTTLMTETGDFLRCLVGVVNKKAGSYPNKSFKAVLSHFHITQKITDVENRD